jgi:hypothetical protein
VTMAFTSSARRLVVLLAIFLLLGAFSTVIVPSTASAQQLLPCEEIKDPWDAPCITANETWVFAVTQVWNTIWFVKDVKEEVGETVFQTFLWAYCTAFPEEPACQ